MGSRGETPNPARRGGSVQSSCVQTRSPPGEWNADDGCSTDVYDYHTFQISSGLTGALGLVHPQVYPRTCSREDPSPRPGSRSEVGEPEATRIKRPLSASCEMAKQAEVRTRMGKKTQILKLGSK